MTTCMRHPQVCWIGVPEADVAALQRYESLSQNERPPSSCHPRAGGSPGKPRRSWIPAPDQVGGRLCAGMTRNWNRPTDLHSVRGYKTLSFGQERPKEGERIGPKETKEAAKMARMPCGAAAPGCDSGFRAKGAGAICSVAFFCFFPLCGRLGRDRRPHRSCQGLCRFSKRLSSIVIVCCQTSRKLL
jgi:hypothetical protein